MRMESSFYMKFKLGITNTVFVAVSLLTGRMTCQVHEEDAHRTLSHQSAWAKIKDLQITTKEIWIRFYHHESPSSTSPSEEVWWRRAWTPPSRGHMTAKQTA